MTSAHSRHETGYPPHGLPPAAAAVDLTKVHCGGAGEVTALDHVTVSFHKGQFTAIMGPSGSGKSTLMQCLAGLDSPTSGSVRIGDQELSRLSDRQLTQLRRERIGFVFQAFHLLPTLTVAENITLPLVIAGRRPAPEWLDQVITALGLTQRLTHRPGQLSGGQQQRVACARALAGRPQIIFADEPTGNLDSRSGAEVLSLLTQLVRHMGQTIVMVTHDPVAATYADRVVFLADGRIVDEIRQPDTDQVLERMKQFDLPGGAPGR
ncbi:ABC transporter ATP-binding protein [Streptomyces rugosispiralis]|uniref:ABC transporter ATP-binding protein n=1 Tax=Streptomyces rugosispiralis TaxID=2967341 RepID=A0ABT1VC93_9ACTN|nr:ABC transporter ATP-binding protein [Streptomyces rugosispiralis]MCQ8194414.1 ABC transporter ATP-binding protein [Streptomyces rugosispiralis]